MKNWALLLALVAAGAVRATPTGQKWGLPTCGTCAAANTQCVGNKCVPSFRIASSIQNTGGTTLNGAEKVPYDTAVSRLAEAFKNWTGPRITACSTVWNSVYAGTFTAPSGIQAVNKDDQANSIIWLGGAYWRYSSATLALTTVTYTNGTGELIDADVELNNDIDWSDTAAAGTYDYESVALHEAGHFLGLDHTASTTLAVMYAAVPQGATKRVLAPIDIEEVCSVYPTAGGGQGATCSDSTQCTEGRVCESAAAATAKICTADCTGLDDARCPIGTSCQASSSGFACLKQPGVRDMCKFCTKGSDCATGVCVTDQTSLWCPLSCTNNAQCGVGYTCDESHFCKPTQGACTTQCTIGDANCAVGFTCQSGTCKPSGHSGDRCEVLGACDGCTACVGDPNDSTIAFCRPCCGGAGNTGYCASCSLVTCGSESTCIGLANGKDQICLPSTGRGTCQTCSGATPCQAGLTCSSGRCHSACNPASPGTCAACLATGTGAGLCGCAGETAKAGELCGQTASAFTACGSGLLCVATPSLTCRVPCTAGAANACRAGETCTSVGGGQSACVPSAAGTQCAACTGANACGDSQLTCYGSRCYATCNLSSSGRCATCVATDENGNGVCACDDQIKSSGEACGSPLVASCQPGTVCVESVCRPKCDLGAAGNQCPLATTCRAFMGAAYCLTGSGGGPGGSDGGLVAGPDGGALPGPVPNPSPCGCTSLVDAVMLLPMVAWLLLRSRARGLKKFRAHRGR